MMSDQQPSIYLQTMTNTETDNEESSKIYDGLKQYKIDTGNSSKEDDGTVSQKVEKIDGELKNPEDKMCIISKSRTEDRLPTLPIYNENSGGSTANILLEDEMYTGINSELTDGLMPIGVPETYTSEMWSSDHITLSNTVNSDMYYQQQTAAWDENEHHPLKRIKIEDTSDGQFQVKWALLQQDSSNFNDWENILDLADYQNNIDNARLAYSAFLELYPLCCKYWIKYANFEKRNNNQFQFEQILEAGLRAIPISVDLWVYYSTYFKMSPTFHVDRIREEFETSLKLCGLDFRSDRLWHNYISWEVQQNNIFNAAKLYYRLLRLPTINYLGNFYSFQQFVMKNLPQNILESSEFSELRCKIMSTQTTSKNILTNDSKKTYQQILLSKMRNEIVNKWHLIHKDVVNEFNQRLEFEKKIKWPDFQVDELNSTEIQNWKNYIDFEKITGNCERISFLYKRCLIRCISVEELWLDYISYLSSVNLNIADVYKKALFHHSESLELNLKYFYFAELNGLVDEAIETSFKLHELGPISKKVAIKTVNIARGNYNYKLHELFHYYLQHSTSKDFSGYIAVKYARFVWKHDGDIFVAFNILHTTIRKFNISVDDDIKLFLTLVDLKMEIRPKNDSSVINTINNIMMQCKSNKGKLQFSKKKMEYVKDHTKDYGLLCFVKKEHKCLKQLCYFEENSRHNTI